MYAEGRMKILTPIPNAKAGIDYEQRQGYRRHVLGVDLGTVNDPTAVAIIEDSITPLPQWGDGYRQLLAPRQCICVQSYRLKTGISYTQVVDHLKEMMADQALDEPRMFLDASGVGLAVSAMLTERRVKHTPVSITAGDKFSETDTGLRVAKGYLMTTLAAGLGTGELRISKNVQDIAELKRQLEDFQVGTSTTGQQTFASSQTAHDDSVLSLALAWLGCKQAKGFSFQVSKLTWR